MDLFKELKDVALQESLSGDFPSWLLSEVLLIAEQPELYAGKEALIRALTEQIRNFDPYAGAGCFNDTVGLETVQATIRQVMSAA